MYTGIEHLHNVMRWAVLLTAFWVLLTSLRGGRWDKRPGLFYMISCDLQLVLGLILYLGFTQPWKSLDMSNAASRFWAVEHIAAMLIAWVVVHMGYALVKKAPNDAAKHRKSLIFYGLSLVLILASIPWPFRAEGIARGLFPGM